MYSFLLQASKMSDKEADLSPQDPSEEAVMALAITQANELVSKRFAKCASDSDVAFTFKWLSEHAEVLWLHHRLNGDFDLYMDKMFKQLTLIPILIIDPDCVIEWQMKNTQHWLCNDDEYLCHQVLLLGWVQSQSGLNHLVSLIWYSVAWWYGSTMTKPP